MTQITVDNKQYDIETLSDKAKAQLFSMQFYEKELARLQAQTAEYQTALWTKSYSTNPAPYVGY